jgi:3-oxoacyl-[acyl-carrier protein] reductase
MDLGLKDKVAIVAASSKGLGKATAMELAREGAKLTICSRNEEALLATAQEISAATKAEVLALPVDVTKPGDVTKLVEKTVERYGKLDILVANAGGPPTGTFENFSDEDWAKALELNLLSSVRMAREVTPHMKKQGSGRIIFVTSVSVKQPLEGLVLSNSARAGVTGMAKSLSNELGKHNITVNCVLPGYTDTDRAVQLRKTRAEREKRPEEELEAEQAKAIPLGRIGKPEEFAAAVTFLASARASFITGVSLLVDGGFSKGLM